MDFVDPAREEWMHRYLQGANQGPLSAEGLREIYGHLLELTKRETAGSAARAAAGPLARRTSRSGSPRGSPGRGTP